MKIVLISYFYRPLNTVSAARWKNFVSQLKDYGFSFYVLTGPWNAKNQTQANLNNENIYFISDPLSADAKRLKSLKHPVPRTTNKSVHFKPKLLQTLKKCQYLLIDGKFLWSLRSALHAIILYKTRKCDLVVVSGSPWSSVFFCSLFCWLFRVPFVIDFRDLWADEPYSTVNSGFFLWHNQLLQKFCITKASGIIAVNDKLIEKLRAHIPHHTNAKSIPSGFFQLPNLCTEPLYPLPQSNHLLVYAGTTSPYADFKGFLQDFSLILGPQALSEIVFYGDDPMGELIEFSQVRFRGQLNPDQLRAELSHANVLLLTLGSKASHYTTGKLISYLEAGRPILYYGPPDSEAAQIIHETGMGWVVARGDLEHLRTVLYEIKNAKNNLKALSLTIKNVSLLENYLLKNITKSLKIFLDNISKKKN